jgi:hypothetical protein
MSAVRVRHRLPLFGLMNVAAVLIEVAKGALIAVAIVSGIMFIWANDRIIKNARDAGHRYWMINPMSLVAAHRHRGIEPFIFIAALLIGFVAVFTLVEWDRIASVVASIID